MNETTVEVNRYRADVRPQAAGPMEMLPETTLGRFFNGLVEAAAHPQAYDAEARRRLWELSERLI